MKPVSEMKLIAISWDRIDFQWFKYGVPCLAGSCFGILLIRKLWRRRQIRKAIAKRQAERNIAITKLKDFLGKNKIEAQMQSDILKLTTMQLQAKLQSGDLLAVDVLRSYQTKALLENDTLNFITEPIMEAEAWAEACDKSQTSKGLLHGIPISLKENMRLKGKDSTVGVASLIGKLAPEDFVLVKVLKEQGAIPFVRTNVPQTMLSFECSNPIFGKTGNPYDPSRTPGGSSGGEGAILGAGASIIGLGSDIAGSIRIPCHFCGVTGIKPTYGRISTKGMLSLTKGQTNVIGTPGPMARDVDGLVLMMKALLTPLLFKLDRTVAPIPFQTKAFEEKGPLKIGFYTFDGYSESVPACNRAVLMSKKILEDLGYEVVPFMPPRLPYALSVLYFKSMGGDGGKLILDFLKDDVIDPSVWRILFGCSLPNFIRRTFSKLIGWTTNDKIFGQIIRSLIGVKSVNEWWHLANEVNAYKQEFYEAWDSLKLDAVICPGFGFPAVPYGYYDKTWAGGLHTPIYNLLDCPAGSLPITTVTSDDVRNMDKFPVDTMFRRGIKKAMEDSEDLPVNIQVVCLPWKEELTLRIMKEIETSLRNTGTK